MPNYQLKIGSEYFPSYSVRGSSVAFGNSEYIVELLKAANQFGNSNYTGLINGDSFANNTSSNTEVGRALYGVDCDAFGRENVESGTSTIENSPITITFDGGAGVAMDAYLFLYSDVVYSISPSGQIAVSK